MANGVEYIHITRPTVERLAKTERRQRRVFRNDVVTGGLTDRVAELTALFGGTSSSDIMPVVRESDQRPLWHHTNAQSARVGLRNRRATWCLLRTVSSFACHVSRAALPHS